MEAIEEIMTRSPIIPVMVVRNVEDALPMAEALYRGGFNVLEVTLRTPVALEVVSLLREELPQATIGVGTVVTAGDVHRAALAGAQFLVSPGTTSNLLHAMLETSLPLLPGVATVSEALRLTERGIDHMKLFPASAVGGTGLLKSLVGPLPDMRFCPTGGITAETAPEYLALPNVLCVGGSWMIDKTMIANKDWAGVEQAARDALAVTQS